MPKATFNHPLYNRQMGKSMYDSWVSTNRLAQFKPGQTFVLYTLEGLLIFKCIKYEKHKQRRLS